MAYRADIEIAVRGAQELKRLQSEISATSKLVDGLNNYLENIGSGGVVRSLNNLKSTVADAAAAFNKAALNTEEATLAARKYVTATNELNAGLRERAQLLKQIAEEERKSGLARAGIRETTQYGGPIGPGPASPVGALVGQKSPVEERIRRIIKATEEQAQLEAGLLRLEQKSAKTLNEQLQAKGELNRLSAIAVGTARALANAPAAPLLLAPAAPGAPAMGGGARRRITGAVERLGGARTEDQAAMALRFAQALQEQVRPLSQIDALYAGIAGQAAKLQQIKALPDSAMLNASARGIKQLEIGEDGYNRQLKESADRLQQLDRLEESRARRARKLQDRQAYFNGEPAPATGTGTGGFGSTMRGRAGGAISSAIIGGGFPLLFGQGPAAAVGGGLGGLAGGLLGGGFGFALSIAGTAIGDLITQSETLDKSLASLNSSLSATGDASTTTAADVKQLAKDLQITNDEAIQLVGTFGQFKNAQAREALASIFGGVGGAATFEAIAKAGLDEKSALDSIFELRKYIGNETATQLALQLDAVGATQTQAQLLEAIVKLSIQNTVATQSTVQFTDNLLSTWENIVAGIAGAVGLAIEFIQKMREGSLLRLPFLDQVADYLGGVKARTGKQIAEERGAATRKRLQQQVSSIFDFARQETQALRTQSAVGDQFKPAKKDKAADQAAREAERVAKVVRSREAEAEVTRIQMGLQERIFAAEQKKDTLLAARLQGEQRLLDLQYQIAQQLAEEENPIARMAITKAGIAKVDQQILENTQQLNRIEAERAERFKTELADLDQKIKLRTAFTEEARRQLEVEYAIQKLRESGVPESQLQVMQGKMFEATAPLTEQESLQKMYADMNKELMDMISLSNLAGSSAKNIGSAFGQAFQDVVNGSATAQEALANMMQQIGQNFVSMAAQIIAQQTTMIILGAIMKALGVSMPGGGGGGGSTDAVTNFNLGAAQYGGGLAGGGSARAGTPYLVGERGPELFVPGTSGGVMSNSDLRASMGAASGSSGSPVLNMTFETSTINGVEYVSRDQLEAAMAATRRQATRDGASRGMSMTLDKLQQSPSTRKRVGF